MKSNALFLCLAPLILAGSAMPACAQDDHVVPSGRTSQMDFYSSLNPDCSSRGYTTIRLTAAPVGGQVFSRRGTGFPTFGADNPHVICNARRVPGTVVLYRSRPGFVGNDAFSVEGIFPDGFARQTTYAISVR